jgi:hypothetical protein
MIELGGMLHAGPNGAYDWLWASLIALVVITIVDFGIIKYYFKLKSGTGGGARWFAIHVFCNLWITWVAFPDLYLVFFDPMYTLQATTFASIYPLAINQALHFYHMVLFFDELVFVDWLHHGVMTLITVPLLFTQNPTPIINANHIFITGIPGAIDYIMLVMVKQGKLRSSTEKAVNCFMNVWIRAPGIFFITVVGYVSGHFQSQYNELNFSPFQFNCLIIILLTNYWNAFYFLERVVGSNYRRLEKERMACKKVEEATMLADTAKSAVNIDIAQDIQGVDKTRE